MMELTLKCLGDLFTLCEEEEERFGSIDEILVEDKEGRNEK